MNEEAKSCPFCKGTGKINTHSYLTYLFDEYIPCTPLGMNITYTVNTESEIVYEYNKLSIV